MEVRIRLQRSKAAKKRYNYRVVAISRSTARDGRHLEILGHYDAAQKPAAVSINQEKLDQWIQKGARMSNTVRSLVKNLNKN